jgi:hypothetical protein
MRIFRRVAVLVVYTMIGGPPERAFLHAGLSKKGQDKLKYPGSRIGVVREVAVVSAGNKKHPEKVESGHQPPVKSCGTRVNNQQWCKVKKNKTHFVSIDGFPALLFFHVATNVRLKRLSQTPSGNFLPSGDFF